MKFRLWSDLHLEFRNFLFDHIYTPRDDDAETTLLLAGDIGVGAFLIRPFIEEMCKHFKHVVMVAGNHEYYHHEFHAVNAEWQAWELEEAPKNFHFLLNDYRILDGVRIIGGTMWTSFDDGDPFNMAYAHRSMSDYVDINFGIRKILPDDILREHDRFIRFLLQKFDEPFDGKTVVMSHHSPGNSLKRRGRKEGRDSAYFADIEGMIGYHDKAVLWVHGHTHRSWDYMINNTRVVCNPYGYWNEATNGGFDPEIVIEV